MKNKILLLSVLFVFILSNMFAQTLEIEWGPYKDMPRKTNFQKIIGSDDELLYVVQRPKVKVSNNDMVVLKGFSTTTMLEESSSELKMPLIYNKPSVFDDIFYLNGKLVLFSSVIDDIIMMKKTYAHIVDENGGPLSDPKLIGEISIGTEEDPGMEFSYSHDKSLIIVHYHNIYNVYTGEPYIFKYVDSELNIVFNKSLVLPYENRKFEVLDYKVGKSGNIYLSLKVEPAGKKKRRTRTSAGGRKPRVLYEYYMHVFNKKKDDLQDYKILVQKYFPSNLSFEINEDEEVLLFGFATKKSDNIFTGIFYQKLIPRYEKISLTKYRDFSKDRKFVAEFSEERNGENAEQFFSYSPGRAMFLHSSGLVLLWEQYYVTTTKIVDPKTKKEVINYYHHSGDIIAANVSEEDQMLWVSRIPKSQFSTNDNGYYSSFIAISDVNKVKVMFNDHPKNFKQKDRTKMKILKNNVSLSPSGLANMITLYNDGTIDKAYMFHSGDKKTSLCPRLFLDTGDGYVIYGQEGKKYRWGNFMFE
jgi:hypothetical protein